jgi:NADPH2:quinone reductase
MRAALYRKTGPSSVLNVEEVPTPEPGPGQVRVRVEYSGVNPTDWKTRSGATGSDPEDFQVPHQDASGVVDAVGEGVEDLAEGDRVWVYLAAAGNKWGTAAQFCVVPAHRAIRLAHGASFELGASLGVPALTAAHCLGDVGPGSKVLVAGGAGAVGHYAIELAKAAGAGVATTVSNPDKAELAKAAGADLVVNYKDASAADQLREFGPVDRIVELALGANLDLDLAVSRPGTQIVVYAAEAKDPVLATRRMMGANITVHWVLLYGISQMDMDAAIARAMRSMSSLSLLPLHVFSLDEVAQAQDAVEAGAVGKVLVRP